MKITFYKNNKIVFSQEGVKRLRVEPSLEITLLYFNINTRFPYTVLNSLYTHYTVEDENEILKI